MRLATICAALLLALCMSPGAVSEPSPTTNHNTADVAFRVLREAGEFIGCEIEFRLILQQVRNPGIVWIDGSVSVMTLGRSGIVLFLKLVPSDLRRAQDGTLVERPFDPSYGYAVLGSVSTAGKEAQRRTCPAGGFCAVFRDEDVLAATFDLPNGGLTVGYQRTSGGLDETVPVTFGVAGEPSSRIPRQFSQCSADFFRAAAAKAH
jgi:hypothetical protein